MNAIVKRFYSKGKLVNSKIFLYRNKTTKELIKIMSDFWTDEISKEGYEIEANLEETHFYDHDMRCQVDDCEKDTRIVMEIVESVEYGDAKTISENETDITKLIRESKLEGGECGEIFGALMDQGEVLGGKLWTTEDIEIALKEKGWPVTEVNMDAVLGNLHQTWRLNDCTDDEWEVITDAVATSENLGELQKESEE